MINVNSGIFFQANNDAWFSAHQTLVLGLGESAYHVSGKYKFGDGSTQLQNLNWNAANNFIPLTGTASGSPITGGLEFNTSNGTAIYSTGTSSGITIGSGNDPDLVNNATYAATSNYFAGSSSQVSSIASFNASYSASISTQTTNTSSKIEASGTPAIFPGIVYRQDYSANFTSRSLIDKGFADGRFAQLSGSTFTGSVNGVTPTQFSYLTGLTSDVQNQLNNLAIGIGGWKAPARVMCSTNVNISSPGSTLDGVTFSAGDVDKRVVLNGQTTASQNGVYNWNGSSSAMTRTTDCSTGDYSPTGVLGMVITIEEGTYADQMWVLTNNSPITVGSTALSFIKGSATTYTGSTGITLTGNNFTIDSSKVPYFGALSTGFVKWNGSAWAFDTSTYLTAVTGTSNRITVTGGSTIDIAATYVGQTSITTLGTLTAGATGAGFTLNFGTSTLSGSIPITNTDAKIKGSVAATSGLIPFGTGTADTLTTSTQLKFNGTSLLVSSPSDGNTIFQFLANGNGRGIFNTDTPVTAFRIASQNALKLQFGVDTNFYISLNSSGNTYFGGTTSATETIQTNGNIYCDTAGKGIVIKSGSNARIGTATLSGGTVTVSNTSVTTNSRIFLSAQGLTNGGYLGYSISVGTSFTITSSNASDARTISWIIVESA